MDGSSESQWPQWCGDVGDEHWGCLSWGIHLSMATERAFWGMLEMLLLSMPRNQMETIQPNNK